MTNPNQKDQMHPEDVRNLIIFAIFSVAIWFLYDTFILAPQVEAIKQARLEQIELGINNSSFSENRPETLKLIDRSEAISKATRIAFENKEVIGTIKLKGGRIDDLSFNEHFQTVEKRDKVSILNPAQTQYTRFVDMGWVSADKTIDLPNSSTFWNAQGNTKLSPDNPVTLMWDNNQGVRFERIISIDDQYMFYITQKVINYSGRDLHLYPYGLVSQTGIPTEPGAYKTWISYEGPQGFIGGSLEKVSYKDLNKNSERKMEAQRGWISFSDKYWLTALIPQQDKNTKFRFKLTPDKANSDNNKYQVDFTASGVSISNGETGEYSQRIYVGVKKILTLEEYEASQDIERFDLAVDFGWFWFFTYPFFLLLHNLGLLFGNMGFAIIVQTIILRMAVFPLTNISYRSFAKMKVVSPQIQELRDQHKDDKEKLQAEIVKLYQREGVNPMSGCLPIVIQIPIFFAFYKILFTTIEVRHAPFIGWINDLSAPDPTSIFNLFGLLNFDVSFLPYIGVWPCLMLVASLVQRQLNPPPQDKTQRIMMNFFPFFITYIMARFASGLVIYWTMSALLSAMQQMFIMHRMGV
ncbi:MAG: membrane protein insertase YidC, partial [Alphaproteobacteria bacterium]|nr:membrane protein insertase YidC [Alphaproteobacteria bacterium]